MVARLTELDRLPAEDWRFHAGDLAHGESPDLDDSSWQVVKGQAANLAGSRVVPPLDRGSANSPRLRPDRRPHLVLISADANGPMPEIIYFNGRRVALGDDLEPIVLFDKAKPGEKVLVAVKLLHTVDKKTFGGTDLKIDFAENRPNPEDLRLEILSAALLIPSISKDAAGGYGDPGEGRRARLIWRPWMPRIRQSSMRR